MGADGFGYTCLDSIDPGGPTFAFEDISGTGSIVLNNNDDDEADVNLPFPFTFYDYTSTNLTVGMNGAVIFGQIGQNIPITNLVLNGGGTPNYMIAPFWDDLDDFPGNASSAVYTEVRGNAPDRRFIIQWDDIPHFDDTGGSTFQLILYEGSNEILFQYLDVDFDSATFNDGDSASVGIRGSSTGNSLPYSFNERLIKDGLAIRFIPPLVNLALTKTVDDDQPRLGQTITYTITVENVTPGMNINDGIISDTIPAGLTFIGPLTLDPSEAGILGVLPQLVSNLTITNGHTITLTFPVLVNTAEVSASNAVITATDQVPISVGCQPCPVLGVDTLPLSLTLAGPVTLDPPSAGMLGTSPLLATSLTISAGHSITITFPVTVSAMVSPTTVITNTAAVTSLIVTTPQTDSVTITIGLGFDVYLPAIQKDFE